MQNFYREQFGELLKKHGLTGNGIEIGVAGGNFSKIIIENFGLKKVYLLDAWKNFDIKEYNDSTNAPQAEQDKTYMSVVEKMKPYGDKVEIIRGDSREEYKRFTNGFFDFVYIDANHKYEAVKLDVANWYPKVKSGGLFAGHDYMDGICKTGEYGVKSAVNEFCKSIGVVPLITRCKHRCPWSWYFIKP